MCERMFNMHTSSVMELHQNGYVHVYTRHRWLFHDSHHYYQLMYCTLHMYARTHTFQPLLVHICEPCGAIDGKLLSLSPEAGNEPLLLPGAARCPLVVPFKVKREGGVLLEQQKLDTNGSHWE